MFDADYTFTLDADLPGSLGGLVFHFPDDAPAKSRKLIEFSALPGLRWYGLFSETNIYCSGVTDVLTTPNPDWAVVCVGGTGYYLCVANPSLWSEVPLIGIDKYAFAIEDGLLVLGNGTTLAAYGSNGLRWRSKRLALDGFTVSKISGHKIYCEAQEPFKNAATLDVRSGEVLEGKLPEAWN